MRKLNITFFILIGFLCISIQGTTAQPHCKDQNGNSVDWFIALKLPDGTTYAYTDSTSSTSNLVLQSTKLDDATHSPLFNTLKLAQDFKSDNYATVMWNDQPFNQTVSSSYAHAKGVIGVGSDSGFLLVHSTPKFPEVENNLISMVLRSNQTIYGQHYFCMSIATANIEEIAAAYNIDWPYVYASHIPDSLKSKLPYLTKLSKNIRDNEAQEKVVSFKTLGGVVMQKFTKSGNWAVPFYDNVVAENLKISLITETWGSPQEDPDCSQTYQVISNTNIAFPSSSYTYKWTKDHSKYAISQNASQPYVCLGDINRQTSQWKRGGGTVCVKHSLLHSHFSAIMTAHQSCSSATSILGNFITQEE